MKYFLFASLFTLLSFSLSAQKVGVVFSGGGAKGLAHVGVLKALEENEIPIDYIVGTSMGGIVGGFYAAGYSASEIERIALSKDFQDWVGGLINENYNYYYAKEDNNASWLSVNFGIDSTLRPSFNSNIVNDFSLNFALVEYLAQASATANYNFDSLFIPFRCMAAEIFTQKEIILEKGTLNEALRATLTVPLFFRPIKISNKYVFDGGIYNNFPTDVMKKEFSPDIIIGCNVSSKVYGEYPYEEDDKLINQSFLLLLLDKSDPKSVGENGVYLEPLLENYSALDFRSAEEIIKIGYDYTISKIEEIKEKIDRRENCEALNAQRNKFLISQKPLRFKNVEVKGVKPSQARYIKNVLRNNKSILNIHDVKTGYYKLVADQYFQSIFPNIIFDPASGYYDFEIYAREDNKLKVDVGGNVATRSISGIYLGLQYNYFNRRLFKFNANFYTGRFYQSARLQTKINFPSKIPFYIEPEITFNNWDYISSGDLVFDQVEPAILEQTDRKIGVNIGISSGSRSKIILSGSYFSNIDLYSNNKVLVSADTLDRTQFNGHIFSSRYVRNSLNRKQYPSKGHSFLFSMSYIKGRENYFPGNTSLSDNESSHKREWVRVKFSNEKYFKTGKYSLGYILEGVLTNQPNFSNYKSTLIQAPAFLPLNDSRTLFLPNFRALNYVAVGLKNVVSLAKFVDFRLEGYLFKPHKLITQEPDQTVNLDYDLSKIYQAYSATLVYHSVLGPVGLSLNYYDDQNHRLGALLHIGYFIYNPRSLAY
ncbi:MAG TPA: patatin-like phospholipase family protein [Cytophagales bacterium]|nr:patatin-like phospholipase family protein [Cytophagales bacterium]